MSQVHVTHADSQNEREEFPFSVLNLKSHVLQRDITIVSCQKPDKAMKTTTFSRELIKVFYLNLMRFRLRDRSEMLH